MKSKGDEKASPTINWLVKGRSSYCRQYIKKINSSSENVKNIEIFINIL